MSASHLLKFDSPIHNLQVFLRAISVKYKEIPEVLPDGVYGVATVKAVEAFKEKFMSETGGSVGYDTWDKIVDVYKEIENEDFNKTVAVYPDSGISDISFQTDSHIRIVQSMLLSLSNIFSNVPSVSITGIFDEPTIEAVKAIQYAAGLNPDGNITSVFWNYLSAIFEVYISKNRVRSSLENRYVTQV